MENDLVFHFAVWNNDEQGLQDLLENYTSSVSKSSSGGASAQPNEPNPTSRLEYRDKRGNTPLLLAYRLGRTKLARMLLAAGADPRARARCGRGCAAAEGQRRARGARCSVEGQHQIYGIR